MRIYLIGLPGSGKTFIGRKLALQLNCRFLDLDELIEETEDMAVREIFKIKGEDYFRQKEKEGLLLASKIDRVIIASGGGTPCFFENISIMKESGVTVFLDTPIPILIKRLSKESDKRPLLKNEVDLEVYLEKTLEKRLPFYSRADLVYHTKEGSNDAAELGTYLKRFI